MSALTLSPMQSSVLGAVKRHKVISARELTYVISFSQFQIEEALDWLLSKRLVYLSSGGVPKRYKPRIEKSENEDNDVNNLANYD